MNNLQTRIEEYLKYCEIQKRLDVKNTKGLQNRFVTIYERN